MAKAWSVLFPDLLPQLPGCPLPMVEHEIRRAAQRLLTESRGWKVTQAAIAVAAATESVALTPSDATQQLVRVEDVWYDGVPMDPTTAEDLLDDHGDNWQADTGTPAEYLQDTPGVLRLYPIPSADATTGITSRLSVAPGETSTGLPDELMIEHRQALIHGALGNLMLYKDKPWTDTQLGPVHVAKFQSAIDAANYKAALAHGRNSRIASRPKWC